MAQQNDNADHLRNQNDNGEASVDDFYFSAMFDEPEAEIFPISDSKYAEQLQFQEALMSSNQQQQQQQQASNPQTTTTTTTETTSIASFFQTSNPKTTTLASTSKSSPQPVVRYILSFGDDYSDEELADPSRMLCAICADVKPAEEKFAAVGKNDSGEFLCDSSFCLECIGKHVSAKLQENLHVIPCPAPDCKGVHVLELDQCRQILPKEVVERWDEALCLALLSSEQRFYCPFRDCSAVMIRENEENEDVIAESECPACHRLFCARCEHAPWHAGIGCDEFQRLNEDERGRDDLLVRELATEKKWKRCPKCLFFVEKLDGCLHITCRCTFQFCYSCGEAWTLTHGGCQTG